MASHVGTVTREVKLTKADLAQASSVGQFELRTALYDGSSNNELVLIVCIKVITKKVGSERSIRWLSFYCKAPLDAWNSKFFMTPQSDVVQAVTANLETEVGALPLVLSGSSLGQARSGLLQCRDFSDASKVIGAVPLRRAFFMHSVASHPILALDGTSRLVVASVLDRNALLPKHPQLEESLTRVLKEAHQRLGGHDWSYKCAGKGTGVKSVADLVQPLAQQTVHRDVYLSNGAESSILHLDVAAVHQKEAGGVSLISQAISDASRVGSIQEIPSALTHITTVWAQNHSPPSASKVGVYNPAFSTLCDGFVHPAPLTASHVKASLAATSRISSVSTGSGSDEQALLARCVARVLVAAEQ